MVIEAIAAANDNGDSVNMPHPLFKAYVKENKSSYYDWVFYFYEGSIVDSSFIAPVMQAVMVNALKTGLGTKHPGYILTFPYYDSTGTGRVLVPGLSLLTQKDAAYMAAKGDVIMKAFGMFSKSGRVKVESSKSP